MNPLITIVIPVYNGSNYLREAIDSALNQDYKNIEIIVVNDGSNDGGATSEIARSYGDKILYFEKENGGVASALNVAVEHMSGDYFSWLSHDDRYYPQKISMQISFLERSGLQDVIPYSDFDMINERSDVTGVSIMPDIHYRDFRYWITAESRLHGCTLLIPKQCFELFGNFNESLRTTQDYDLWFKIAEKYKFVRVPEVLISARHHSQQTFNLNQRIGTEEVNLLSLSFYEALNIGKALSVEQLKQLAVNFYSTQRYLASYAVSQSVLYSNSVNWIQRVFFGTMALKAMLKLQFKQRFLLKYLRRGK